MCALNFVYFCGIVMTNTDVLGRQNKEILVSCKYSSQKYIALKTGGGGGGGLFLKNLLFSRKF